MNSTLRSCSTQPSSPVAATKTPNIHDSKALQMAALTRALSCMKRFTEPITGKFCEYLKEINHSTNILFIYIASESNTVVLELDLKIKQMFVPDKLY